MLVSIKTLVITALFLATVSAAPLGLGPSRGRDLKGRSLAPQDIIEFHTKQTQAQITPPPSSDEEMAELRRFIETANVKWKDGVVTPVENVASEGKDTELTPAQQIAEDWKKNSKMSLSTQTATSEDPQADVNLNDAWMKRRAAKRGERAKNLKFGKISARTSSPSDGTSSRKGI